MAAGINYVPADQVFYSRFPYKIELSPKFKGLGGVSGKRGCQIDIIDPVRARAKLAEFNEKMEKIISNVEYREEIKSFVDRLPNIEYKTRMGGENNLFYFRDPELVLVVVEKFRDVITGVTGPINEEHKDVIDQRNILMRDKLYYNKFRYVLEFARCDDFVEHTAPRLMEVLDKLDPETWRAAKLRSAIGFYNIHGTLDKGNPFGTRQIPINFPHRAIMIYLSDPQDYVYLKLIAGEHVVSNHEVVLFDELT